MMNRQAMHLFHDTLSESQCLNVGCIADQNGKLIFAQSSAKIPGASQRTVNRIANLAHQRISSMTTEHIYVLGEAIDSKDNQNEMPILASRN